MVSRVGGSKNKEDLVNILQAGFKQILILIVSVIMQLNLIFTFKIFFYNTLITTRIVCTKLIKSNFV